ncbi:MAG: hypothetical protein LBG89_02440 [Rickettsiales bacterium]|jgi:hypothetical protein|nr:hypothetical protein [Rickettsiales bacterium]
MKKTLMLAAVMSVGFLGAAVSAPMVGERSESGKKVVDVNADGTYVVQYCIEVSGEENCWRETLQDETYEYEGETRPTTVIISMDEIQMDGDEAANWRIDDAA